MNSHVDPDRFLMVRYGSNRNDLLDSNFDSSVETSDDENDDSIQQTSDSLATESTRGNIGKKVLEQWRKASFTVLGKKKSNGSDEIDGDGGEESERRVTQRGSLPGLAQVMKKITEKQHEKLNDLLHRAAHKQRQDFNLELTEWTSSQNPLFQPRFGGLSERQSEEKSEE